MKNANPSSTLGSSSQEPSVTTHAKCFVYVVDFMILEDLSSIIDSRLSEVLLGQPFAHTSKLTYDESLGLIRFAQRDDKVVFRMPQRTKELDLVSSFKKDKFEAFFVENLKIPHRLLVLKQSFSLSGFGVIQGAKSSPIFSIRVERIMPITRQGKNDAMTPESIQAMIDWAIQRNSTHTQDDASQILGGLRRPVQPAPYTQRFQELALICTKFLSNEAEKVDKYISGLPDNIHGNVMSAIPKTLDETIELANDLMDQKLHTYAERQNDNKRKADDSSKNNHQQQPYKKPNVARSYTTGPSEKKVYNGDLPLCTKCNYYHTEQCAPKYGKWKRYGHTTTDCQVNTNNNNNKNQKVTYTSISSDSDGPSWGIPLTNADEFLKIDPYEEVAQQGHVKDDDEDPEEDPEDDPSEEHEPENDDEDPVEDPNKEHEPEDEDTREPSKDSDETKPFEEDETAVTPPPPRHRIARMSVRPQTPMAASTNALIDAIAADQTPKSEDATMIRRRDDIPEEDMPPQRRFAFTAPSHGCDVAESSAAAARAPRSQYDFVDTVKEGQGLIRSLGHDAWTIARAADRVEDVGYVRALQDAERRMMTFIKEVNLRVNYEAQFCSQEMRGQRTTYETVLHKSAKDLVVTQMMRIHTLEASARTDTVEDASSSC
nr:reverse transcriptase domain-containing protein [Tanacetum cinerariifolium]